MGIRQLDSTLIIFLIILTLFLTENEAKILVILFNHIQSALALFKLKNAQHQRTTCDADELCFR